MNKILPILLVGLLLFSCEQNSNPAQTQINKLAQNSNKTSPTHPSTVVNSNSTQNEVDDEPHADVTVSTPNAELKYNSNPKPGERYKPFWIENGDNSDNGFEAFCVDTKVEARTITKYGYQEKSGRILIRPVYKVVYPFSEGLAGVCPEHDTVCGYINEKGQVLLKWYQSVGKFSEGLADVSIGDVDFYKHGYINKQGKYIIKPQYSGGESFKNGVAKVQLRNLSFCINKKDVEVPCPE